MAQLDRLPILDPSVAIASASSHARNGTNADSGAYVDQDSQGRYVLMEAQGPGAITRIWMTGPPSGGPAGDPSPFGRLQFFFDGEDAPRIDLPAAELYAGKTAPFLAPLCGDHNISSGGNYCDLRVPFAKSIRVVSTGSPAYYNFGYETYPAGTKVASARPTAESTVQAIKAAGSLLSRSGDDPAILPAGESHSGSDTVAVAGRRTLVRIEHPGTVRSIRVSIDHTDDATLQSVWLEARWDGEAQPSISAPLADLFASGAGERAPARGLLAGYLPDRHEGYLSFPMPFSQEAQIELVNRSAAPVTASWTVQESSARYAAIGRTTGYFHATYGNDPATTTGVDYTLLDAAGTGKIVGVSFTEQGPAGAPAPTFMEGDERVSFDGSLSPAIYGTGTEDFFSGAYYYTTLFTLPDHGANAKEDVFPGVGRTAQYRLMLSDPWSFRDGVHFGIEHAAGDGEQTASHSVVYWYGIGRRALRQTDTFDVADAAAATAAGYNGATGAPTRLTAFFEGDRDGNVSSAADNVIAGSQPPPAGSDPMGEALTMTGLSHGAGAVIRFNAALDPANHGAILRRLLDQGTFGQRAEVFVGGTSVGTWFTSGSNTSKRWLESDFRLPAAVTAGRAKVMIELHVLPPVDPPAGAPVRWTDYRYTTLSMVG